MTNHKLESMWDQAYPGWDAAEGDTRPRWRITAKADTTRRGVDGVTPAGRLFTCHLCGRDDSWLMESRAFVCEHEPVQGASFAIRQISSVPFGLVDEEGVERV